MLTNIGSNFVSLLTVRVLQGIGMPFFMAAFVAHVPDVIVCHYTDSVGDIHA